MIQIWLFALDLPTESLIPLAALLGQDERHRAAAFHHARDRDRFIARRGQLRLLLAAEGGGAAHAIRYLHNAQGKPALADMPALRFSLSHSAGLALCAVARDIDIGCDVELRDPALADPMVARRLFAPAEWRALEALPQDQHTEGFFNCWTRKEAFIKAIGLGVSHPLDSFAVTLAPAEPPRILFGGDRWSIASFAPAPGYQAALVAPGDAIAGMTPPRWFSGAAPAASAVS